MLPIQPWSVARLASSIKTTTRRSARPIAHFYPSLGGVSFCLWVTHETSSATGCGSGSMPWLLHHCLLMEEGWIHRVAIPIGRQMNDTAIALLDQLFRPYFYTTGITLVTGSLEVHQRTHTTPFQGQEIDSHRQSQSWQWISGIRWLRAGWSSSAVVTPIVTPLVTSIGSGSAAFHALVAAVVALKLQAIIVRLCPSTP